MGNPSIFKPKFILTTNITMPVLIKETMNILTKLENISSVLVFGDSNFDNHLSIDLTITLMKAIPVAKR